MNIVHLKYAIMVADLGSISKASEKLYIAQPNISRAIKELENDLNITIFDRDSKGMVLTPEGGRFITYGKRVLAQIDEMEKMFKETKKKDVFSISVPRSSYISEAFVEFSKSVNRNNVELLYRETNAYRVLNTVINEGYKLGIIRYSKTYEAYFKSFFERKDLKYELLNSFKYVLAFSKDSVLATKEKITFDDLKGLIQITHADPYVPSLPMSEVAKEEINSETNKTIYVFERATQFALLENNKDTFMWVSPIPEYLLNKYNLIQKECIDNKKEYNDILIYRSTYVLNSLDKLFIAKVNESKERNKFNK